jgi:type IV pilus assembly protein PilE
MRNRDKGFTLIEVMITVAIVAILAAVALPAYNQYILRSRIPAGLDALSGFQARMEQRYQDTGTYADAAGTGCGITPAAAENFTLACTYDATTKVFTATATGSGAVNGVRYSVDSNGVRKTLSHPKGVPATDCWSLRGGTCDS